MYLKHKLMLDLKEVEYYSDNIVTFYLEDYLSFFLKLNIDWECPMYEIYQAIHREYLMIWRKKNEEILRKLNLRYIGFIEGLICIGRIGYIMKSIFPHI